MKPGDRIQYNKKEQATVVAVLLPHILIKFDNGTQICTRESGVTLIQK